MNTGAMRHRVTFQQPADQKDSHGADKNNWEDVCTASAEVAPLSGRALFAAQQNHSEVTGIIKMRYDSRITAKMRAVFKGKIYSIHAVLNIKERDVELNLLTSEGVREN